MPVAGAFIVPHPPLIIPQIGGERCKDVTKTIYAYERAARDIAALSPEVIVIATPHGVCYADYLHISSGGRAAGDFKRFGVPGVSIAAEYDGVFVQTLCGLAVREGIPAGTLGEKNRSLDHGTMIPLYFINQAAKDYRLVRVALSGMSALVHYRFGKCIREAAEKSPRRVVMIASGDLSHRLSPDGPYGFRKEGPEFDRQMTKAMGDGDFLRFLCVDEKLSEAAGECGLRAFQIMAGALDGLSVRPELYSYEGPFGVGYAVAAFAVSGEDENRRFDLACEKAECAKAEAAANAQDPYVRLALQSVERYVRTGRRMKRPEGLPKELTAGRGGVFVSLKLDGRLRGCIGTISPVTECLADEIIQNAVSAAAEDPRFSPVREDELSGIDVSVDVLMRPESVRSARELDVRRYGVIVRAGTRRGLLLPDLEGVDTPEQQIEIARSKAGISPDERFFLERFEVVRHR